MHVAEQTAEVEACLQEYGRRPGEVSADVGLLGPRFTAVHAIHVSREEIAALGAAGANVCACPSTERNLGDGVVPADALKGAGVHLALGSDSQAAIDLLEDARQLELHLRLVRERRGLLDAGALFGAATEGGARSLGVPASALRSGSPADFICVDVHHPSLMGATGEALLPAIVFGARADAVREVYVGGKAVVRGGQHVLQEESGRAFSALAGRLFG
jgi:formimidoylglutamate deiminase